MCCFLDSILNGPSRKVERLEIPLNLYADIPLNIKQNDIHSLEKETVTVRSSC